MKRQKTKLSYSDTNGVIEEGPAPEALIVCIVQVPILPTRMYILVDTWRLFWRRQ